MVNITNSIYTFSCALYLFQDLKMEFECRNFETDNSLNINGAHNLNF
jgi:hypothetical protein